MLLGDGAIGAIFHYVGIDFVQSTKYLNLGIACGFILATMFKAVYMIMNQDKINKILNK